MSLPSNEKKRKKNEIFENIHVYKKQLLIDDDYDYDRRLKIKMVERGQTCQHHYNLVGGLYFLKLKIKKILKKIKETLSI